MNWFVEVVLLAVRQTTRNEKFSQESNWLWAGRLGVALGWNRFLLSANTKVWGLSCW